MGPYGNCRANAATKNEQEKLFVPVQNNVNKSVLTFTKRDLAFLIFKGFRSTLKP